MNHHRNARGAAGTDPDEDAFLEAAVGWALPHLKRIRTSESWTSARPAAVAALLQKTEDEYENEDNNEEKADQEGGDNNGTSGKTKKDDMEAAVSAWTNTASLQSVLEAIGHLGTSANPAMFHALLASARAKALTLEQQHSSLGGNGLRDALEAQRKAEAKASEAEARAAKQTQSNEELKASIASMIAEPCPLRANLGSLIAGLSASDTEIRKATAGA